MFKVFALSPGLVLEVTLIWGGRFAPLTLRGPSLLGIWPQVAESWPADSKFSSLDLLVQWGSSPVPRGQPVPPPAFLPPDLASCRARILGTEEGPLVLPCSLGLPEQQPALSKSDFLTDIQLHLVWFPVKACLVFTQMGVVVGRGFSLCLYSPWLSP